MKIFKLATDVDLLKDGMIFDVPDDCGFESEQLQEMTGTRLVNDVGATFTGSCYLCVDCEFVIDEWVDQHCDNVRKGVQNGGRTMLGREEKVEVEIEGRLTEKTIVTPLGYICPRCKQKRRAAKYARKAPQGPTIEDKVNSMLSTWNKRR